MHNRKTKQFLLENNFIQILKIQHFKDPRYNHIGSEGVAGIENSKELQKHVELDTNNNG